MAHCTAKFVEVPQASSGQQEMSRLLGYPQNSTGRARGVLLNVLGNWWSSSGAHLEPPTGGGVALEGICGTHWEADPGGTT